jgi:recombination protein U
MTNNLPVSHAGRGSGLEALLNLAHQLYRARELAWIEHNHVAGIWRGRGAGRKPVFTPVSRQSAPDYYGCFRGRFLAFDAKEIRGRSAWRLDKRYAHQLERLQAIAAARGVAWFAVERIGSGQLWLLRIWPGCEWPVIDFAEAPNADMLKIARNEDGYYDWLPLVRSAWFV